MLKSPRVRASAGVLDALKSNPYVRKEEVKEIAPVAGSRECPREEMFATLPAARSRVAPRAGETEASAVPECPTGVAMRPVRDGRRCSATKPFRLYVRAAAELLRKARSPFRPLAELSELLGQAYSRCWNPRK